MEMKIRKKKNVWDKIKKDRYLLFMLLPGIVYLLINNYVPMFGIVIAFKQINYIDGIWGSPWVGLKNFEFLFGTSDAWLITRNTVLYNIVFIFTTLIVAVGFAIMLNELKNRLASRFYQSVMFLPSFYR